jgi:hypothetical protein
MAESSTPGSSRVHSRWEEPFEGLRWRSAATLLGSVAWLSFTLLYVGFWATGFTVFQSVIVILVSILILGGVLGALWTLRGPSDGPHWD